MDEAARQTMSGDDMILGAVSMWGTTQMHKTGMRAEFAKPLAPLRPRRSRAGKIFHIGLSVGSIALAEYLHSKPFTIGTRVKRQLGSGALGLAPPLALATIRRIGEQRLKSTAKYYQLPIAPDANTLEAIADQYGARITIPLEV
jgi:hypothetical protein